MMTHRAKLRRFGFIEKGWSWGPSADAGIPKPLRAVFVI
jgi:hypothetical protein